jgi:membrane-bound serine protease (ClpP class)
VRRLAMTLLVAGAALGLGGGAFGGTAAAQGQEPGPDPAAETTGADLAPVDVFEVSGILDPIVASEIEQAIDRAERDGSQALVLQLNSRHAVVSRARMVELAERISAATVPVAIWVGPSGARAYGLPGQLLAVAAASGMAPGARIGDFGVPLEVNGAALEFGRGTEQLRRDTVGADDARDLGVLALRTSDQGAPVLRSMILSLDGLEYGGRALDTVVETQSADGTIQQTATTPRFFKLGLVPRLFHTVASVPVAYLLLVIGLSLLIFEFFTAGVGVAGVVGVVCTVLACYGLGVLPVRGWALALLLVSMLCFAVDVQVGIPRFWTGVGLLLFTVASVTLYRADLRISWITLIVGIGGVALTFVVGMPSMVRTRFATPTIGREGMLGELGRAMSDLSPEGIVRVREAQWRARTNRATPIPAGDPVRVVAIDGITLEVEPETGAARDYRERRAITDESPSRSTPSR